MAGIFQPVGQVRFTNVTFVKYKKGGKRFEVTCYRNKVVNWRNKVETDIDEVLQAPYVFSNASKGVTAKASDLKKAFGTDDHLACCVIILEKGELQVSDKEREVQLDSMFREVASIVADKCVNPDTGMPHPVSVIEAALKEMHFSVNPRVATKRQALEAIPGLKELLPIQRTHMHFRMLLPIPARPVLTELLPEHASILSESGDTPIDRASGWTWEAALAAHTVSQEAAGEQMVLGCSVDFTAEPEQLRRMRQWCTSFTPASLTALMDGSVTADEAATAGESAGTAKPKRRRGRKNKGAAVSQAAAPAPISAEAVAAWFPATIEVVNMTVAGAGEGVGGTTALGDRDIMSLGATGGRATRVHEATGAVAAAVEAEGGRVAVAAPAVVVQPGAAGGSSAAFTCRKCGGENFSTREEYRSHFRSEAHVLNLKRAMMGLPPIAPQECALAGADQVAEWMREATPQ